MSDYEAQRRLNIAQNKAKLAALGLDAHMKDIRKEVDEAKSKVREETKKRRRFCLKCLSAPPLSSSSVLMAGWDSSRSLTIIL